MKKLLICSTIIIFLSITLVAFQVSATIPKIEPYVNDFADLLTPQEELNLNVYLDNIEKNTTWEIAVVTVLNTDGEERVSFANKIGDENGVGKLNKDNGVVVLYSLENEGGGAIATGRYSESIFNDAKVGRIGRDNKHFFDDEKYYAGFLGIVVALEEEIKSPIDLSGMKDNPGWDGDLETSLLFLFGFLLIIFIVWYFSGSPNNSYSGSGGYSSSSGSRSSSSGGSSFGGGSFGGGGARF